MIVLYAIKDISCICGKICETSIIKLLFSRTGEITVVKCTGTEMQESIMYQFDENWNEALETKSEAVIPLVMVGEHTLHLFCLKEL